ncbi:MAG: sugar tyrosine-protein kinase [Alphaproteobacteria bacterium]
MDDTRIALLSVALLVVVLAIIIGSVIFVPSFTALLATLLAWANLAYLVGITIKR